MRTAEFYARLAEVTFLALAFWLAIVQLRPGALLGGAGSAGRRAAHAVSIQFAVVAATSLVALADDGTGVVWRTAFGAGALWGIGTQLLLRPRTALPWQLVAAHWTTCALYVGVLLVAVVPRAVDRVVPVVALQAEAGLFGLLVFAALNEAFWLLFTDRLP